MSIRARGNVRQQTHRSAKAGEFQHKLHEDMTLPDADLAGYPEYAVMVLRWNAGVAAATIDGEQLGMKHADVPEDVWLAPWKLDPPNPQVHGFDDYLSRKFGNDGDDDADDSNPVDDTNGHDDSNNDTDDDVDDDPVIAQVQLDYAMDAMHGCYPRCGGQ